MLDTPTIHAIDVVVAERHESWKYDALPDAHNVADEVADCPNRFHNFPFHSSRDSSTDYGLCQEFRIGASHG